jgi:hypothetical protein
LGSGRRGDLVSALRRNELSSHFATGFWFERIREVRAGEDAIANTRDACATQNFVARKMAAKNIDSAVPSRVKTHVGLEN